MRRLIGAIQFLTVLPIRAQGAAPGKAAVFFPLVGAALGWVGGRWFSLLERWIGSSLAALVILGFWLLITGGLHEDGLADVADALGVRRSRQKALEILKDSRIGAFGALALVLLFSLRWQALVRMPASPAAELAVCGALAKAAMVAMAWLVRPIGEGLGAQFSRELSSFSALVAILLGFLAAAALGGDLAVALAAAATAATLLLAKCFAARLGGVNGDCLGATSVLVETLCMILVSCRNCGW